MKELCFNPNFLALPSGQISLLICIFGVIPVLSAQNDFQKIDVPLEIWLPHRYPHEPPLFFVRLNLLPPQNPPIIIRATSISDVRGIISYPGTFNTLIDAINELRNEFSAELPIVTAPPQYNVVQSAPVVPVMQHFAPAQQQPQPQHHQQSQAAPVKRPEDVKAKFLAKITERLAESDNSASGKDSAQEVNYNLLQNRKDRERENMALSNEISLINKELESLYQRQQTLDDWIVQSDNLNSIDKILVSKDQRSAQLADLLALEAALNDALFGVMKKILSAEPGPPITSGVRVIRDLSRRHFLTKYHIKKIVSK